VRRLVHAGALEHVAAQEQAPGVVLVGQRDLAPADGGRRAREGVPPRVGLPQVAQVVERAALREAVHLVAGEPVEDVRRGVGVERSGQRLAVARDVDQREARIDVGVGGPEVVDQRLVAFALGGFGRADLDVQHAGACGRRPERQHESKGGRRGRSATKQFHLITSTHHRADYVGHPRVHRLGADPSVISTSRRP